VDRVQLSKLLALALRHDPSALGLTLDPHGWASVEDVLRGLRKKDLAISEEELEEVVATSPKQRFALSDDGTQIRANQGHSIAVDLELPPAIPPETLFHGTTMRFADAIRDQGLLPRARMHVHLSADEATARVVAVRRQGPHVILRVRAGDLHREGQKFYRSENGVWLTDRVPPTHLVWP
jgi:putative RNA 2'-phosphotransferase